MNDHIADKVTEEELHSESNIDIQQSNDTTEEFITETINDQHDNTLLLKPIIAHDILPISIVTCPNLEDYPESYRSNSKKEELILTYIENFCHQYHYIYRNRKPLFLNPLNECGISKFVCTTIRPTMLPFSDLTEWNLAADFIADHLNYDLLEPPYELPKTLWSPTKILFDQHGNCFDYSNLLCSLLIGAGYDAYIVSGYATREICYMDTTRLQNPHIRKHEKENIIEEIKNRCKKYPVKLPKDLTSRYDAYMHERYLKKLQIEKDQIKNEENQRIADIEKTLLDPLYGIRIHAWILILPGKRDISKRFYIEPTTGYAKETNDKDYLGIESIWNHQNLWVNMQDCSNGCEFVQFNLNDQTQWECLFPYSTNLFEINQDIIDLDEDKFNPKQRSTTLLSNQIDWFEKMKFYFTNPIDLPVSNINAISYYNNYSDKIKSEIYKQYYISSVPNITKNLKIIPKDIDLPLSWVNPLEITSKNFNNRYPNSYKKYFFKKTCVEKYASYSKKDGLTIKISEFNDYNFKELIYITFSYEHRYDKLEIREYDLNLNIIYEKYRPGRKDHLKEYIYDLGPTYEQTMIYYHKSRLDYLFKRHETNHELTDYFINHENFLESRKTIFESKIKKLIPRSIVSITERFHRNPSLNVNDDIQELIYAIKDDKFIITYHRDSNYITSSTRTYIKPSNWNDKAFVLKWNDDLEETYQADEDFKQISKRDHYYKLIKLIEQENDIIKQIRKAEDEIYNLQSCREQEELSSDLEISIYDIDRNEKSKIYKKLLQEKIDAEKHKKDIYDIDYLAPYLAAIGNPEQINSQIAEQLRFTIKHDFKIHSIRTINLMQLNYENILKDLIIKQQWYQKYHLNISKEDEFEYEKLCQQTKFHLDILQERLKQYKEYSKENYLELETKLNEDIRLKEPYLIR